MENNTPFIAISNRALVFDLLKKLQPTDKALFGLMGPQHMVEHLCLVFGFCNGKNPQQLYLPQEKANIIKTEVVSTQKELMVNFKSPVLPKNHLLPLQHAGLTAAIQALAHELDAFEEYFRLHPTAKPLNPVMGEMDYREWTIFHNKHFTHHYKQFNLL